MEVNVQGHGISFSHNLKMLGCYQFNSNCALLFRIWGFSRLIVNEVWNRDSDKDKHVPGSGHFIADM